MIQGTPYRTGAGAAAQQYDKPSNFDKAVGYGSQIADIYNMFGGRK